MPSKGRDNSVFSSVVTIWPCAARVMHLEGRQMKDLIVYPLFLSSVWVLLITFGTAIRWIWKVYWNEVTNTDGPGKYTGMRSLILMDLVSILEQGHQY